MTQPPSPKDTKPASSEADSQEPPPSYIKLAMRNMVRKGGKSLFHFFPDHSGPVGAAGGACLPDPLTPEALFPRDPDSIPDP